MLWALLKWLWSSDKEMAEAKKGMAATSETSATASGDLDVTKKDLAADIKDLSELHHECLTEATNFEESTKSRGEELKAQTVTWGRVQGPLKCLSKWILMYVLRFLEYYFVFFVFLISKVCFFELRHAQPCRII